MTTRHHLLAYPALVRSVRRGDFFFLGRPPNLPLARAAFILALLFTLPPRAPRCAAIQFREPRAPASRAGTHRSASSFGKCRPKPEGLISITSRSDGLAVSSPWAWRGWNATST